jgi:hypothetical protein
MMPKINRMTMRINGQRGTWFDPQADHSEKPEQALRKACAAWVVNNGCINEFIKSLHDSGYFVVLVPTDASTQDEVCAGQASGHAFVAV